jgi:hypothetical protein
VRDCDRDTGPLGKKSDKSPMFGGKFGRSDPKGLARAHRKTRFSYVGIRSFMDRMPVFGRGARRHACVVPTHA